MIHSFWAFMYLKYVFAVCFILRLSDGEVAGSRFRHCNVGGESKCIWFSVSMFDLLSKTSLIGNAVTLARELQNRKICWS